MAARTVERIDPRWEYLVWDLYAYAPEARYTCLEAPIAWREGVLWVSLAEADWQAYGADISRKADAYGWQMRRMKP